MRLIFISLFAILFDSSAMAQSLRWIEAPPSDIHINLDGEELPYTSIQAVGQGRVTYSIGNSDPKTCSWHRTRNTGGSFEIFGSSPITGQYTIGGDRIYRPGSYICYIEVVARDNAQSISRSITVRFATSGEDLPSPLLWTDLPHEPSTIIRGTERILVFKASGQRDIDYKLQTYGDKDCRISRQSVSEDGYLVYLTAPRVGVYTKQGDRLVNGSRNPCHVWVSATDSSGNTINHVATIHIP